jgi:hypothetical protein
MSSEDLLDNMDDINAIRLLGMRALLEKLGPAGMIKFLNLLHSGSGSGDYTEERHLWLDKLTMEEVINEIKEMNKTKET